MSTSTASAGRSARSSSPSAKTPTARGSVDTPDRVARMYAEVFQGLHQDPRVHLEKLFTQKYDEMVLIKDIRFESFCEHHLLPFIGQAHVAYIPNGKVDRPVEDPPRDRRPVASAPRCRSG